MYTTDKVSVIMPVYNASDFLDESIQSVLNQTYRNIELILIDDNSTDNSLEICKKFEYIDRRVIVIYKPINSGAGISRNDGLLKSSGRYIAFLDADDLWKHDKIEKQVNFLKQQKMAMTFSFYELIDINSHSLKTLVTAPKKLTYQKLLKNNYVGNLTGIYDTKLIGKIPISNIRKRQDWLLWLQILKKINYCEPVQENLASYRKIDNSLSSKKLNLVLYNYLVYRKGLSFSVFKSTISIMFFLVEYFFIRKKYIFKL